MQTSKIGERIGVGNIAEVFAYGEGVLKLYFHAASKPDAFREAAILTAIEPLGLPAPRVSEAGRFGERWGLVMTRAEGRPFTDVMVADPAVVPAHIEAMVELHRRIHSHIVASLPSHKAKLADAIRRAPLGDVARTRLVAQLDSMPTGDRLCHLDFHPSNILGEPGSATVVDWLDASIGDPAADVCRSFVLLYPILPALADGYLAAYASAAGLDPADILRWRPIIAGARLAENVPEFEPYLLSLVTG